VERKEERRKERKRKKGKRNEGRRKKRKNHLIHLHIQLAEKRQAGR
jgi:hypothetical protein